MTFIKNNLKIALLVGLVLVNAHVASAATGTMTYSYFGGQQEESSYNSQPKCGYNAPAIGAVCDTFTPPGYCVAYPAASAPCTSPSDLGKTCYAADYYSCVASPPTTVCHDDTGSLTCAQAIQGGYIPASYTEGGPIDWTQHVCVTGSQTTYDTPTTTGSCSAPPTVDVAGCTDRAANNFNELASSDNGTCVYSCTSGANSCGQTNSGTKTGINGTCSASTPSESGCAPSGSCSAPTQCGTYPSCSAPDCAGTCGGSAVDYNGATAGCGSAPASTCSNGATNYPTCTCASDQVLSGGSCVSCNNGGCSSGSCNNGGSNPPTCDAPSSPSCSGTPETTRTESVTADASGGTVWGSQPFTTDSNHAKIARFIGVPQGQTATLQVTSAGCVSSFSGSTANGVTTSSYAAPWQAMNISCISNCSSAPATASISANPERVRSGNTSLISWTSSNATSCSISGPGLSSSLLNNASGTAVPITQKSIFSITCGTASNSVTVNIVPIIEEF